MKRLAIALLAVFAIGMSAYAGTVESVTGKVDVLVGGSWKKATVGMTIADGTKIMTAVGASVKIKTTGGYFSVKELSMVTFQERTGQNSSHQTVRVDMGTVGVQFTRAQGMDTSFQVQTPRGTASVRGTEEIVTYYPMSGMTVTVIEGLIIISDAHGNSIPLTQDQIASIAQSGGIFATDDQLVQYFGEFSNLYHDEYSQAAINEILQNVYNLLNSLGLNEPELL